MQIRFCKSNRFLLSHHNIDLVLPCLTALLEYFILCYIPTHVAMFKNPAPGQYSPEKAHPQGEAHAPCYSMSSRTRYRKSKLHIQHV